MADNTYNKEDIPTDITFFFFCEILPKKDFKEA